MEIFLPSAQAMQVPIRLASPHSNRRRRVGRSRRSEFRLARSPVHQKQVETRSERDKLVFRVKLRVPPSLVTNTWIR